MTSKEKYFKMLADAAGNPKAYKVCHVCGCVVDKHAAECPHCSAYRFNEDSDFVSNTALDQASGGFSFYLSVSDLEND